MSNSTILENPFPPGSLVPYFNFWTGLVHQLLSTYISLLPEVFSCVSLVLGCQICFIQIGFIDIGSSPVGCLAGCAAATVGSCGQIMANSISVIARRLMEQHPEPNLE
jgi:hypothetical protein